MTKEINGFNYSRQELTNYKLRIKLEIKDTNGFEHNMDVYTDCDNIEEITKAIDSSVTDKVLQWDIVHTATRQQDEANTKMINEWLNDF